jgi:lipopolysaccharide biosynthesis glycosyltransferase
MRTAYCFTPDRAFFAPAVRAIASMVEAEPDVEREIFLICEPEDVLPGFDKLPAPLRGRIKLLTLDFSRFDATLAGRGRFSRAVFRRLFLDEILPAHFERIVTVDSDMLIVRPGLKRLESFDLGDKPLAAAYDMIFLMDFKGDALARQFQRSRRALGLAIDTPYFNAGLMTIDRAAWRAEKLTERVVKALRDEPKRYPFMEQDALNATLKGNFMALSPRFNFMGDFFLLDLERRIEPIVLHLVNAPKHWELRLMAGRSEVR